MTPQRLASFNVDLDEVGEYYAIHGLGAPPPALTRRVYELALPRLLRFADALELPLTLFVIGRDLDAVEARRALTPFTSRGDELGNHSQDHAYDLSRRSEAERREQLIHGAASIAQLTGEAPLGFRAPGYTLSPALIGDLIDLGYRYDSSRFACPAYYAAKAAVLAWQRLRGRRSASVLDHPRVLLTPALPHRLEQAHSDGPMPGGALPAKSALQELPITVTRGLRLPFIGTSLALLGRSPLGAAPALWLTRQVEGLPFVNLSLHGLDFLDAQDGLSALSQSQPDLRIPWQRKAATFTAVVQRLRGRGYQFHTLAQVADRFRTDTLEVNSRTLPIPYG
ncbi:MAG: polysaccharide deacetylase family protein [Polyangiaceae bacterium]|nr:polysaccharide deacetylase family protein [Polyangiaceae bacterium]MCW5791043.1 polysaccharide deacetylase family protein [Polyangiaceae bacterium]